MDATGGGPLPHQPPDDCPEDRTAERARLRRRLASGGLWATVENLGRHLLSFTILVILARLLGPESFGLVALATVFLPLCTSLLQDTFAEALIRQEPLTAEHADTVFWLLAAAGLAMMAALILAAEPIATLFDAALVADLVRWLGLVVVLNGLAAVPIALLKRQLKFRSLALRTSVGLIAGGVVSIAMALDGWGAWSLVGQLLAQAFLQLVVVWSASGWRPRLLFSRERLREVWGYGTASVGLGVITYLRQSLPRFFVGVALGPAATGLLQLATKLSWTLRMALIYPVTVVALPAAARLQTDPVMLTRLLVTATRYCALITFPGFVGVAVIARELVPVLVGEGWDGAVVPTQMLALTGLFFGVTAVNGAIMRAMNRAGWNLLVNGLTVVLMIAGLALFADRGLAAVSLVVLVSMLLTWPLQAWIFTRSTGLSSVAQHRALLPVAVATAAMAAAVAFWRLQAPSSMGVPLLLVSEVAVGAVVYIAAVLLLARRTATDLLRTLLSAVR